MHESALEKVLPGPPVIVQHLVRQSPLTAVHGLVSVMLYKASAPRRLGRVIAERPQAEQRDDLAAVLIGVDKEDFSKRLLGEHQFRLNKPAQSSSNIHY